MEREFEQEYKMIGLKIAYYRKLQGYTQEKLAEDRLLPQIAGLHPGEAGRKVGGSYLLHRADRGPWHVQAYLSDYPAANCSGAGRACLQVSTVRLRDTPSASPMARQMGCFGN